MAMKKSGFFSDYLVFRIVIGKIEETTKTLVMKGGGEEMVFTSHSVRFHSRMDNRMKEQHSFGTSDTDIKR